MTTTTREEQMTDLVTQAVANLHFELIELSVSQNKLKVYLDGPEGDITLEECRRASRGIEADIEMSTLFSEKYVLEVSSPGINRPLKKARDFAKVVGRTVTITFVKEASEVPCTIIGKILSATDDVVLIGESKAVEHQIAYAQIRNAKIKFVI